MPAWVLFEDLHVLTSLIHNIKCQSNGLPRYCTSIAGSCLCRRTAHPQLLASHHPQYVRLSSRALTTS